MKYTVILASLFLAGCVNTMPKWPDAPRVGTCPKLDDAMPSEKLSELLSTVTKNYGKYHECSARTEAWEQWYRDQKKIYEDAKK